MLSNMAGGEGQELCLVSGLFKKKKKKDPFCVEMTELKTEMTQVFKP